MKEMTLSETLTYLKLTHRPAKISGRREICDKDGPIFEGTARQVWAWLRETGRIK